MAQVMPHPNLESQAPQVPQANRMYQTTQPSQTPRPGTGSDRVTAVKPILPCVPIKVPAQSQEPQQQVPRPLAPDMAQAPRTDQYQAVVVTSPSITAATIDTTPDPTPDPEAEAEALRIAEEKAEAVRIHKQGLFEQSDVLINHIVDRPDDEGVLIPLKTTMELEDDHIPVSAYITRVPTKCANAVVSLFNEVLPNEVTEGLTHLRRCCKPSDLPPHLKTTFMNDASGGRQMHTGKSPWVYVLVGEANRIDRRVVFEHVARLEGVGPGVFLATIPAPLLPPTSQMQAAMWSQMFWPTIYRKNNPLGPHPSMVSRATDEIANDTTKWMKLAHRIALKGKRSGYGEAMGAVIVQRDGDRTILVAAAADARWHSTSGVADKGNAMSHCSLRAISMVAQKLVRAEATKNYKAPDPKGLAFDALQDLPLLSEEQAAYEIEHPSPDGYLCHGLEMYMTHEPCVMCSMAILHSRMGKVVFANRMPLTGGMCAEHRRHDKPGTQQLGGGKGLGLFWRRELNWSLLAWEWEPCKSLGPIPPLDPSVHG